MNNLYDGTSVKQIVGHTRVKEICEVAGVILVDCLEFGGAVIQGDMFLTLAAIHY